MSTAQQNSEVDLVLRSRSGDTIAFEELVRRHMAAVGATAYALTGNSCTSDDITQETFLTAWQRIGQLKDTGKLRPWLCSIARNIARRQQRNSHADPLHNAGDLTYESLMSTSPRADDVAIAAERDRIVWSAIGAIPEEYRLPLVLYYREGRSTREVAATLDLTEEAVRQRLSRARAMLKQEITATVEGALQSEGPSPLLLGSIVAAIGSVGSQATASAIIAGATKATGSAGAAAGAVISGAIIGPLIGIAGGIYGTRQSMKSAKSPEERAILRRLVWQTIVLVIIWCLVLGATIYAAAAGILSPVQTFVIGSVNLAAYVVLLLVIIQKANGQIAEHKRATGQAPPAQSAVARFEQQAMQSPKQWRTSLVGSFGGAIFGSLSWILVAAGLAKEWTLFAFTLLFGAVLLVITVRRGIKQPAGYWLHACLAALALLIYTHLALLVNWSPELEAVLVRNDSWRLFSPRHFGWIAEGLLAVMAIVAYLLHGRARQSQQQH